MNKKRVLVTGSNGFTGVYVCDELKKRNYQVFGLTNDFSTSGKSLDLRDRSALKEAINTIKPEAIVHLDGITYVDHGEVSDFKKVNVNGTVNLLSEARKSKNLESVIVASSANVYGNVSTGLPIKENYPVNPENAYAESKAEMEERIRVDFQDLPVTVVRPFNYTGVGQSILFLIPKIVNAFKGTASELVLGNLNVSRDFSDVRFIAKAYTQLLELKISHKTLNLCSGKAVTLNSLVTICSKITKHQLSVRSVPSLCRPNEVFSLCGDIEKMVSILGFESAYSLEDTLKWMLLNK